MKDKKSDESKVIVEVIEDGPLRITGHFILKDLQRDTESALEKVLLCRCGKSCDKPFCDGSHRK